MANRESFRIVTFKSSQFIVRLHPSFEQHTMPAKSAMKCAFGTLEVQVSCVFDTGVPRDTALVSSRVADILMFHSFDQDVQAVMHEQRLHIGPTIGVLANPLWDSLSGNLKTTKQLPALQKLMEAGAAVGAICYVFRIQDVDFSKSSVKAYRWAEKSWIQGTFPMPDVIYDQVTSRKTERDPNLSVKRATLSKRYDSRIFNDGFFDKWQVHEWLVEDAKLQLHVPETKRYTTMPLASTFVQKHAMTYLKPIHGSLGLGILRMMRQPDGSIAYDVKRSLQTPTRGKAQN